MQETQAVRRVRGGWRRVAAGCVLLGRGREEKGFLQCTAIGWCIDTPSDLGH